MSRGATHGSAARCGRLGSGTPSTPSWGAALPTSIALLYVANTLGAGVGAFVSGFVLIGTFGYVPTILFAAATLFVIVVLLHYSTVLSKLTDENVLLAQKLALLEERVQRGEAKERRDG